jgi:hypothetical protein
LSAGALDHGGFLRDHAMGDRMRLHANALLDEVLNEVVRAFFLTLDVPMIHRTSRLLYRLGDGEVRCLTNELPHFSEWCAFMDDGVTPGPSPSLLLCSPSRTPRELNPDLCENLDNEEEDSGVGTEAGSRR